MRGEIKMRSSGSMSWFRACTGIKMVNSGKKILKRIQLKEFVRALYAEIGVVARNNSLHTMPLWRLDSLGDGNNWMARLMYVETEFQIFEINCRRSGKTWIGLKLHDTPVNVPVKYRASESTRLVLLRGKHESEKDRCYKYYCECNFQTALITHVAPVRQLKHPAT